MNQIYHYTKINNILYQKKEKIKRNRMDRELFFFSTKIKEITVKKDFKKSKIVRMENFVFLKKKKYILNRDRGYLIHLHHKHHTNTLI